MSKYADYLCRKHDLMTRGTDMPKDNAIQALGELISLIQHAAFRNHAPDPDACTACDRIAMVVNDRPPEE